jgi:hypothetical protein
MSLNHQPESLFDDMTDRDTQGRNHYTQEFVNVPSNLSESRGSKRGREDDEIVDAPSVTSAVTLRGWQLCEALLMGRKDVENRNIRLDPWVALHYGHQKIDPVQASFLSSSIPDLPQVSDLIPGTVFAVAKIARSVKLNDLRREFGCCDPGCDTSPGGHHAEGCRISRFAHGPICNMIQDIIRLPCPVPARGALNQWKLPAAVGLASQCRKKYTIIRQ